MITPPTPQSWHDRFTAQAQWTAQLRRYLVYHLGLDRAQRILEVGCGTGAITPDIRGYTQAEGHGLDINPAFLRTAQRSDPATHFTCGDGLALPYPGGAFDAAFCHYLLLWVPQPERALAEMARVTRPGGWVIAFAEPDYGGRIDAPAALEPLGQLQTAALRQQGADPLRGRQLSALFHAAGLERIQTGVIGGQWQGRPAPEMRESEWNTLAADVKGVIDPAELARLKAIDERAWETGERVLFIPTFYAFGQKISG